MRIGVARKEMQKRIVIIAGPNGAGKTTFAREYLRMKSKGKESNGIDVARVDAAMKRAAKRAGEIAKQTNTPLIIFENGKVVEKKVTD